MAPRKPAASAAKPGKARVKKNSQPTQRPAMQRVMVLGANMKIRFEWRPW